jgi:hypothetical protein
MISSTVVLFGSLPSTTAGQPDSEAQDSKTSIDTTGLDLSGIDPVFTTYVVTKGDIENVGEVPSSPAAQAKAKWLPYRNVAEAVSIVTLTS